MKHIANVSMYNVSVIVVLLLAGLALCTTAQAQWVLLDDFETHTVGQSVTNNATKGWVNNVGTDISTITNDPDGSGSKVLHRPFVLADQMFNMPLGGNAIADDSTSTLFMRFRLGPDSKSSFACSLVDFAPDATTQWWVADSSQYSYFVTFLDPARRMLTRYGGVVVDAVPLPTEVWYNVWVVIRDDASPDYSIYRSQGTDAATGDPTSVNLTNVAAPVGTPGALTHLWIAGNRFGVYVDDIYIADGERLTHPLVDVPPGPTPGTVIYVK